MAGQPLDPGPIQVAVGHQCTESRQTYLTAVGVPGKDQVCPIIGHGIEHAGIGRMRNAQSEIGLWVPTVCNRRVVVPVDVSVTGARARHHVPSDLHGGAGIVEIDPTGAGEDRGESVRVCGSAVAGYSAGTAEIFQRIDRLGIMFVIGPKYEHARSR